MPRMDLMVDTNVYFIHFKCGSKVLVDETKKKEFLDLFLRCYLNDKFRIFAFSVLDREIYLLAGWTEGEDASDSRVADAELAVLRRCWEYFTIWDPSVRERPAEENGGYARIRTMEDMLKACRYIHLIPITEKYASEISGYWWSSFQAYRGTYEWRYVETEPLLEYLDWDIDYARRLFIKLHQHIYDHTYQFQIRELPYRIS